MATTSQALTALRDEVEGRIKALTPNDRVKAGAVLAVYQPRDDLPITQFTGKSRTFDLGMPILIGRWGFGYTEQQLLFEIPIVIVYRRRIEWFGAASDDCHQIYHDLLCNTSSIDGVARRYISDSTPVVTQNPEQPWDYYTLTLQAYLSVTAT